MADTAADGSGVHETPARPLVLNPTDEWLARISDQLDELNRKVVTVTAKASAKKGTAAGRRGGTRAEVRGD